MRVSCVCMRVSHGDRPSSFVTHSIQINSESFFFVVVDVERFAWLMNQRYGAAIQMISRLLFFDLCGFRLFLFATSSNWTWNSNESTECRLSMARVCVHGFSPSCDSHEQCHFYGKSFRMTFTILFRSCDRYCVFRLPIPVCRTRKRWLGLNVRIHIFSIDYLNSRGVGCDFTGILLFMHLFIWILREREHTSFKYAWLFQWKFNATGVLLPLQGEQSSMNITTIVFHIHTAK